MLRGLAGVWQLLTWREFKQCLDHEEVTFACYTRSRATGLEVSVTLAERK